MIIALDCHYTDTGAAAAACGITAWPHGNLAAHHRITDAVPHDYVPGEFYRRELPLILRVLSEIDWPLEAILIDAYVDLAPDHPGLGRRLVDSTALTLPVIGVAKTRYSGATHAIEVLRGTSSKPLLVTAANIAAERAAELVRGMHGANRIPTLILHADHCARGMGIPPAYS